MRDTHSIPSHGIETGRKGETGCGARSSRDPECVGTHYNFPETLESGKAIEDLTKDEVEQLVVMLREVVDDEFWCSRTQHYDIAADDSDSNEGSMEALVHGTPTSVRDNGAFRYSGEDETSDHDSYLAGRGDLCLGCEENPVYALLLSRPTQCALCEDDGMYMLWCEGCRCFRCPECYDAEVDGWRCGSLLRGLTAPTHPAPSPIPLGALGEGAW